MVYRLSKTKLIDKEGCLPITSYRRMHDTLFGNEWCSKLDANSAYYDMKVKESDKDKTAFITKHALVQFTRMSFGPLQRPINLR